MTVLICICSWITVPFMIPFTMQTFAVFCSLLLLGGKSGTAAIVLYLFIGLAGLPVFSGFHGGLWHIAGPTGGYMIGFVFCGIIYTVLEPLFGKSRVLRWAALFLGLVFCYFFGTVWFIRVFSSAQGTAYGFMNALSICVLPYLIPDLIKLLLAVFICDRLKRSIPMI